MFNFTRQCQLFSALWLHLSLLSHDALDPLAGLLSGPLSNLLSTSHLMAPLHWLLLCQECPRHSAQGRTLSSRRPQIKFRKALSSLLFLEQQPSPHALYHTTRSASRSQRSSCLFIAPSCGTPLPLAPSLSCSHCIPGT